MLMNYVSPPKALKLINAYPPYLFAGISVDQVNNDMTEVVVKMRQHWFNKNYVGTHFGGSLYSMCDPFFMFILLQHMREDHIIWDKAASIQFVRPGRGTVRAKFSIGAELIESYKRKALEQFSFEPVLKTLVYDEQGKTVAEVQKTLYIRRKDAKQRFKS